MDNVNNNNNDDDIDKANASVITKPRIFSTSSKKKVKLKIKEQALPESYLNLLGGDNGNQQVSLHACMESKISFTLIDPKVIEHKSCFY